MTKEQRTAMARIISDMIKADNVIDESEIKDMKRLMSGYSILLTQLADLLSETEWRYGISSNTGKNVSYIIYIYLSNGEQLSWHCNEYQMLYYYPEINCEWDGQACMTMEKILNYIGGTFHIGIKEVSKSAA